MASASPAQDSRGVDDLRIALLREMLEIESHSGREGALADYLVCRMRALGLEAFVDGAGNAVGVRDGGAGAGRGPARDVVLLGHMDTVPGRVPVRLEGDLLYGRGAVDAKGPLAAFVAAAAASTPPPGARIVVIGAVEEECATSRGARFAATQYRPSACIVGEPSGWDAVTLGYKGRLLVDYRAEQPSSHTAGDAPAVAEGAVEWWLALRAYAEDLNAGKARVFDRVQPSLRSLRTSSDGLADAVEATAAFRLPPGADAADVERVARALAARTGSRIGDSGDDRGGGFERTASVVAYGHEVAYESPRSTPIGAPFLRAIRRRGGTPRFKVKTGTSDMNVVGPLWGCPVVAYGPGDSRLDHTPNEHVSVGEFLRAIGVLEDVLADAFELAPAGER